MSYPVCLDLAGKKVLVVGGGAVAVRKVKSLLRAKAKVAVIAPEFASTFQKIKCQRIKRRFCSADLKNTWLIIGATDDEKVNYEIARLANKQQVFVNIVDQPKLCSFTVPAIACSGKLQIAVSTGGVSPILAQKIRNTIQPGLKDLEKLAQDFGKFRQKVQKKIGTPAARKKFWQSVTQKIDA